MKNYAVNALFKPPNNSWKLLTIVTWSWDNIFQVLSTFRDTITSGVAGCTPSMWNAAVLWSDVPASGRRHQTRWWAPAPWYLATVTQTETDNWRSPSMKVTAWGYRCLSLLCYLWPLLLTWINFTTWISNYIHYKVWDEIIYPFLNFNGCTVEV